MKSLIILLSFLIVMPVFGQRKKKEEDPLEVLTYVEGVAYALPRTGIRVCVNATKNEFTPGPFAQYAEQLLGITGVKHQSSNNWVIGSVKMVLFSEPDPLNVFKAMGETASLVELTLNGCLAGINTETTTQGVKVVTTNQVFYASEVESTIQYPNLSDLPFITVGDSTNQFRPIRLNIEQKAAQAASRILECRKLRFETAAGLLDEFPPDGLAYVESIKQLEKIERDYISLFVGKNNKQDYSYSFEYIPSSNSKKGEVIFRFSEENGVMEKTDLSGKPVILEVSKIDALTNNLSRSIKSENPNAGKSGIYYRLPGMAEIKLIYELKTFASARLSIAQFGSVAPVPENLLDGNYKLEFHPETGALKSIIKK